VIEAGDEQQLSRLLESGAVLIPARLVSSPLHAVQVVRLARRNWERGLSRARLLPLEALLYAMAASGRDATRTSLSEVAREGPKPREPLVAVCFEESLCSRLEEHHPRPSRVEWLNVPEGLALARSALAALEVERKRMRIEETA